MLKKDLLEKIKDTKDDEDINSLLKGTDIEEQFKGEEPTLDVFKEKIKNDKSFKKFMDSEKDKHLKKATETMKEKGTWETEFEDVMKEKYPDLVKDPKDKKILEMQNKVEKMEKESARKDLLAEAIKYASKKKLPNSIVEKCLGEDLDKTKEMLDAVSEDWSKGIESVVNEKMKSNSYTPGKGPDGKDISIGAAIAAQNNKSSSAQEDPWASK